MTCTWHALVARFNEPAELVPGDGPAPDGAAERKAWMDARKGRLAGWSPARFRDDYRNADNVLDVGALVLDLDSNPDATLPKRGEPALDPARLRAAMAAALPPGTAWAAHTSPSSAPGRWRWRAVVPLSKPVDANLHRALTACLRLKLATGSAPAMAESDPGPSMDPARLWYAPGRDGDNPYAYRAESSSGEPLDVGATVAALTEQTEQSDPAALADSLAADCEAMRADRWPDNPVQVGIGDLVDAALDTMRARASGDELPIPLPWPAVAEVLGGGLWPGLHVLVGNTGSGKSQWGLQAAVHAAQQGTPVLYIGLELGNVDLVARCLALLAKPPGGKVPVWSKAYLGQDAELVDRMAGKPAEVLRTLPIAFEIAGSFGWPPDRLAAAVEDLRKRYPSASPPLVVLDYLQVVGQREGERMDLRERIGRASYQGRAVARDCGAAVLLVSSTARDNYTTLDGDKAPWNKHPSAMVGLGKESGEIEFSADSLLALVAEPWRDVDSDGQRRPPHDGTHIHLAVAKVRAGSGRWIDLRFDGGSFWEPPEGRHDARPVGWVPVRTEERKPREVALTVAADGRLALLVQGKKGEPKVRPLTDLDTWRDLDLLPCLVGNTASKADTGSAGKGQEQTGWARP
jgi:replicative DNA helicase